MKKTLLLTVFAVLAIACAKESNITREDGRTVFSARFGEAAASRTTLEGAKVLWAAGDEISLLWEGGSTVAQAASAGETTTFSATVDAAETYYAVYPSSVTAGLSGSGLTLTVPSAQHGTFGEANIAVARTSDATLSFKNLCALGKFTLTRNDITEVRFAGAGEEVLCGETALTLDTDGIPSCGTASGKEIVLTPATGSAFAAGTYYFGVIPGTLSGVSFTLKTESETLAPKTSDKSAVFARSKILNFGTLDGGETVSYNWLFSSEAWQAALAASAPGACSETNGGVTVDGWTVSLDGLTYTSGSGKGKWSTSGYINPSGTGSQTSRVFSFEAPQDGTLKVVVSNTGESAATDRYVAVTDAAGSSSQVGGASSKSPATLSFDVKAGNVYIYPDGGGLRFYGMSFTSASGGSGEDPTPAETEELECTDPPTVGNVPIDQLVGYGESVTGGNAATGANILHFNSGKALQTWLLQRTKDEKNGDHSPKIIWLSGTFGPTDGRDFSEAHPWFDVKDVSNLSFFGTDDFVMDRIGFFLVRANNIIIRNINFQQPKANNGADAVSIQTSEGVWVDHCTFTSLNQTKDYEDGSTDVTHASKNVTVSWCRYIKTQKSCLVGHSNSASADAAITATFHHNWFDGSSSRHPRVRFGKVHVYNNLYDGCTTYGVGSAYGAKVLVEYNYFDGVHLPTDICTYPAKQSGSSWVSNLTGSVAGYLYATEDVYVNKPVNASDPYPFTNVKYTAYNGSTITPLTYADFKPSYDYVVTAAEDVPAVVKAGAGYGKLGWTTAPVEVNNGGITDFNGSDDDPTDPDPDDPDDPSVGDDSAHTYTLFVNDSKKIISTKDGAEGGSYFTYSSSLADFSKDYSQTSYTIGETAYKFGLKMDSKGSVVFTTSSTFNTTLRFYFVRRKSSATGVAMQVVPTGGDAVYTGDSEYTTYTNSGQITLLKSTEYTIKQVSGETGVILVIVTETE